MMTHENDAYEPDDPKGLDLQPYRESTGYPEGAEVETEVDDRPPLSPLGQHLMNLTREMNQVYVAGLEQGYRE